MAAGREIGRARHRPLTPRAPDDRRAGLRKALALCADRHPGGGMRLPSRREQGPDSIAAQVLAGAVDT
jgi:hypothetical protein